MTKQEQKTAQQKRQIIITSLVIFAMLAIIALMLSIASLASRNANVRRLESQLNDLNQLITLNEQALEHRHTSDYIEAFARRYLEMRMRDEVIFIAV